MSHGQRAGFGSRWRSFWRKPPLAAGLITFVTLWLFFGFGFTPYAERFWLRAMSIGGFWASAMIPSVGLARDLLPYGAEMIAPLRFLVASAIGALLWAVVVSMLTWVVQASYRRWRTK